MNSFQLEIPVMGDVKRQPDILSERQEHLFDDIKDHRQAILFSIQHARRTQTTVGEEMGIKKSHWSGICNGTKNMSFAAWMKFRSVVCNDIYLQWLAWVAGYRLVKREPSEHEKLQAENERLKQELEEAKQRAGNE